MTVIQNTCFNINKVRNIHAMLSNQDIYPFNLLGHNFVTYSYTHIIFICFSYGCETWSLTLREEQRLTTKNRVLRRIFGPKGDEETGEWRRLHNEELNDLYSSASIIRVMKPKMRLAGHVARMGEKRGAYRILVGRPEGRSHLGDPGIDRRIILKWIFKT
jgi:hypothetical protein